MAVSLQLIYEYLNDSQLRCEKLEDTSGDWWWILNRKYFDLVMKKEPYHALVMLVNISTAQYIVRVLGRSCERGYYSTLEELQRKICSVFSDTVVCLGNQSLRRDRNTVEVKQPFYMLISGNCSGYYRLAPGETVLQGRGRCHHCRYEIPKIDEEKKQRPRPRRKMSEVTKRKIYENTKKFSICKLCKKQCRGFRGLVDHMHRDHEDYKPWRCHLCDVRTAFVKTLYRHLKQEHNIKTSGCPSCGKTFTRAQGRVQ